MLKHIVEGLRIRSEESSLTGGREHLIILASAGIYRKMTSDSILSSFSSLQARHSIALMIEALPVGVAVVRRNKPH